VTKKLLHAKYGSRAALNSKGQVVMLVDMDVSFPTGLMPGAHTGKIVIETAPFDVNPHNVLVFLEIVDSWAGGSFFRNAGHVLQAKTEVETPRGHLAFQEYSPEFPHAEYTLGYAGRPGGPQFYISIMDNIQNHGPASQGSKTEADGCFGRVMKGKEVVDRLKNDWGINKKGFHGDDMGFLNSNDEMAPIQLKIHNSN